MTHPNNLPKPKLNGAPPLQAGLPPLGWCTACLADVKTAMADGKPATEPSPAVCLVGGTGSCFGHLVVQRQSPLLTPNGASQ
jgi:hypothetical protein